MIREFENRPLLLSFLSLAAAIASPFHPLYILLAVIPLGFVRSYKSAFLVGIAILGGFLLAPNVEPQYTGKKEDKHEVATILSIPIVTSQGSQAIVKFQNDRAKARFSSLTHLVPGDEVFLNAEKVPLPEGSGWSHGALYALNIESFEMKKKAISVLRPGLAFRDSFLEFTSSNLDPGTKKFVNAICLGDTSQLDGTDWESFQKTGITHIVSTSGLHATIVASLIFGLICLFPIPRYGQLICLIGLLVIYSSAAGFGAPIVRASVMVAIYASAYFFRREPDGFSALAAAGIFTLCSDSYQIANVGFWLSFVAIASLVAVGPTSSKNSYLKQMFKAQSNLFIATSPIIAAVFGRISLIGFIANALIVPIISVLVVISLSLWLLSSLIPVLAPSCGLIINSLTNGTLQLINTISAVPGTVLESPYIPIPIVISIIISLILIWRPSFRNAD